MSGLGQLEKTCHRYCTAGLSSTAELLTGGQHRRSCQERSFVNGTLLNLVFLAAEGNSRGSHEICGRTVAWIPSEPVEIHDWEHGIETAGGFAKNPVPSVMETGQLLIVRPR